MALEYSEVMTAGAMLYKKADLDKATKSMESLNEWIVSAKKQVDKRVTFGSSKSAFLKFMEPTAAAQKEAAVGISAAKSIKAWLNYSHAESADVVAQEVFLTGNVWPKEVDKFRMSAFGFDDYNASDFIVKTDPKSYYGVSLKKKKQKKDADPTLINKAYDTVLNGKQFDKIKDEIYKIREKYFAGLVKEANKKGILDIPNIDDLDDAELFQAKNRDKNIFDRAYINIKGSKTGGYENDKAPDAMRKFVNKELAKNNNELYSSLVKYMNNNADIFANTLINLVLKTKLYDELSASKKLKDFSFGFALVTGVGQIKKGKPDIGQGNAKDLHTILCGLNELTKNNKKYTIAVDVDKKAKSRQAAKIFFKLSKAGVPILDMELRYKGTFTAQPQFFATVTKEFSTILNDKCLVRGSNKRR